MIEKRIQNSKCEINLIRKRRRNTISYRCEKSGKYRKRKAKVARIMNSSNDDAGCLYFKRIFVRLLHFFFLIYFFLSFHFNSFAQLWTRTHIIECENSLSHRIMIRIWCGIFRFLSIFIAHLGRVNWMTDTWYLVSHCLVGFLVKWKRIMPAVNEIFTFIKIMNRLM